MIRWMNICAAVATLGMAIEAEGGGYGYLPPYEAEPAEHASFVRDNNPAGKQIVAWDSWYAQDLKNLVTAGSVDSVFQQCFGGGFHNDLLSSGPANFTSASATRFDEAALNKDNVNAYFNIFKGLDNFTRAYRDAALARPAEGMQDWWGHATQGGDGITKDPYAISGAGVGREHPVYATPDPTVSTVGPNNSRTMTHTAGVGNANQYVIMVAWSQPENRHAVNIARMYDLARDAFNVPFDNIVVLYGNSALNDFLGDWTAVDANAEYNVLLSGNNQRTMWTAALRGQLFSTNAVIGGNVPDANDKLFIYNTGHGGHARRVDGVWTVDNTASNLATDMAIDLRTDGFSFDFSPVTEEASSIMDDPLGSGSVMIQLLLEQQINSDAMFTIPGVGSVSASSSFVLSPGDVFNYNGVLDDPLVAYQFDVPFSMLASVGSAFEMQIENLDSPYLDAGLVSALSFFGGDQEQAYFFKGTIPEPGTGLLVGFGAVWMMRRRSGW